MKSDEAMNSDDKWRGGGGGARSAGLQLKNTSRYGGGIAMTQYWRMCTVQQLEH